MAPSTSAKAAVPFILRLILLTIEPLFAVMGSILVFTDPGTYASMSTRHAVTFAPDTAFLYTTMGGGWLYFAYVEAVVLRATDEYVKALFHPIATTRGVVPRSIRKSRVFTSTSKTGLTNEVHQL